MTFSVRMRDAAALFATVVLLVFGLQMGFGIQMAHADGYVPVGIGDGSESDADIVQVGLTVQYGQTEARSMLAMINDLRTSDDAWAWSSDDAKKVVYSDLEPLSYDYELERVAMWRAAEIALRFDHQCPDGQTYCYHMVDNYYACAENIAAGQTDARTAFATWQEADKKYAGQTHRRKMLDSAFTHVGIGHAVCNGVHFWVQVFASPAIDTTPVAANDSECTLLIGARKQLVTKEVAISSPSSISLTVGEKCSLPVVDTSLGMEDTWPYGTVPVSMPATTSSPEWTSSDPSVVKVSNGLVSAQKAGKATLTTTVSLLSNKVVSVPVTVNKAANTLTAKGKIASVSFKKLTKKTQTLKKTKAFTVKGAKGKVTYKVVKYDKKAKKKINVSKAGKVTVKKGLGKRTYKLKVRITAAGNATYKAASKTVTLKVKVK